MPYDKNEILSAKKNRDEALYRRLVFEALREGPKDPFISCSEAEICFDAERYDDADEALKRIRPAALDDQDLLLRAGILARDRGRAALGEKFLLRSLDLKPDDPVVLDALSRLFVRFQQTERAEALLLKSEEAFKDNDEIALLRPRFLQIQEGTQSEIEALLSGIEGRFPDSPKVLFERASRFARVNRQDEALSRLNKAIEKDPAFAPALILRANLHIAAGGKMRRNLAEQDLLSAFREGGDEHALKQISELYRMTGNHKKAESLFQEVVAGESASSPQRRLAFAAFYADLNRFDDAFAQVALARPLLPFDFRVYEIETELYWRRKNFPKWEETIREAILSIPWSAELASRLLFRLEERPKRAAAFLSAIEKIEKEKGGDYPILSVLHARLLRLSGKKREAVEILETGAKRFSASPLFQGWLGIFELYEKKNDLAKARFEKALEFEPRGPRLLALRGFAKGLSGDAQGAFRDLFDALRVEPTEPVYYLWIGKLIQTQKKNPSKYFSMIQGLGPTDFTLDHFRLKDPNAIAGKVFLFILAFIFFVLFALTARTCSGK